jgi:tripartite-type tricarboxylate transporter receptor subunit TctC
MVSPSRAGFARSVVTAIAVCAAGLAAGGPAHAQSWPAKPVRFLVPLAAGGPGDVLARAIGQKLSESTGQPVVIDNRPGANTNIGHEAAAKAPPDGYTVLMTASTLTINPALYPKLPFDAITSFTPVTLFATTPLLLVVHPSLPAKSVKELVAFAKARPGQLHFGSAGNGSTLHLAGELFNTLAGVKLVHVPYKGVTGAFTDLLGGQIYIMFPGAPIALPQVQAGKLRALGATGSKRTSAAPELPTVAEAGLPGYEVVVWYGALVPAGTPAPIVQRLHGEIVKALATPDIRSRWGTLGAESTHSTPDEFAAFLKADVGKWAKVVKDSGAKID